MTPRFLKHFVLLASSIAVRMQLVFQYGQQSSVLIRVSVRSASCSPPIITLSTPGAAECCHLYAVKTYSEPKQQPSFATLHVSKSSLTSGGHADGAFTGRDAVHVALRSDTHRRCHWQTRACSNVECPLYLFHVLKVLS